MGRYYWRGSGRNGRGWGQRQILAVVNTVIKFQKSLNKANFLTTVGTVSCRGETVLRKLVFVWRLTYIMDLISCSESSWTKFQVGCWYGPPSCRSMTETDGACWHPVSHLSCSHRLLPVPPYKKTWVWCESKPVMTSWKGEGERETCGGDWYV